MSLVDSLLKWLNTFESVSAIDSLTQLSDGVIMAQILRLIDKGFFFHLKSIDATTNQRIKVNNLKKVMNTINDFYTDVLSLELGQFPVPEVTQVVECNEEAMGRMLQLILGCAINCEQKQEYIQIIMQMEESVQQVIMQSIQEILNLPPSAGGTDEVKKLMTQLDNATNEKEQLLQKCHELELQINMLQDEKSNISAEFEQLQAQVAGVPTSSGREETGIQQKEMKKQVEQLQEDLFKMETQKDELQSKLEVAEKQVEESHTREVELQRMADQARALKDEVDILRETSDKVVKYEATIESYKKKLEELSDLKRQNRILEEKNTYYMQQNIDLEEDMKKTGSWKPQMDAYKKQITELHTKLDSEMKKSDKFEFETNKLLEKLEALSIERDRLQNERDELKETNTELVDELKLSREGPTGSDNYQLDPDSGMLEMIPPAVKEKLLRLQRENKKLKEANPNANENAQILQTMIDDLKERESALQASNRKANQKIMELESRLEESKGHTSVPRVPGSREELELKVAEANKKIANLQESIQKKDAEMQGMEERYKKYIEKAKSVIKTLDPKSGSPEVSALRSQLSEKDRLIETIETETEKARAVREMEERLISSAFYKMSMQLNRHTVEERLANINAQGQSFLARQRQVNQRKPGYNSSDFLDY